MRAIVVCDNECLGESLADIITRNGHCAIAVASGPNAFSTTCGSAADVLVVRGREPLIRALSEWQWRAFPAQRHLPTIVISDAVLLEEELPQVYQFLPEPLEATHLLAAVESVAAPLDHAGAACVLTEREFEQFSSLLFSRSGLLFGSHNRAFLQRGLLRRMQVVRASRFSDYYHYLTRHAADRHEMQKLLQLVTVGETYFLRYPAHFDALRELLQAKGDRQLRSQSPLSDGAPVRCWSAGCSTGEEAYSVAMTVMEALPDWRERDIRIFATDINRRSLKKAAGGVFSMWSLRGIDQDHVNRFFTRRGSDFAVTDEVKSMVNFAPLNLCSSRFQVKSAAFHSLDAIFCRNVLMYLDPQAAARLIEHFASVLKPDGLLFLGHAEPFFPVPATLALQRKDDTFFFRKTAADRTGVVVSRSACHPLSPPSPAAAEIPAPAAPGADPIPASQGSLVESEAAQKNVAPPDAAAALVLEGLLLAEKGRLEEARQSCAAALALDDLRAEAYFLSALLLERTQRLTEALREYGKVILLDPRFAMPRYRLAELYLRLGRRRDAAREYANALRILEQEKPLETVSYSGGMKRDELLAALRTALAQLAATPQQSFQGAV